MSYVCHVGCKVVIMHGAGEEHKNLEGLTVIHTPRFRANTQQLPREEGTPLKKFCLRTKARIWP